MKVCLQAFKRYASMSIDKMRRSYSVKISPKRCVYGVILVLTECAEGGGLNETRKKNTERDHTARQL